MDGEFRVLIVDDDATVRGFVAHVTKRTVPNARIAMASNGREALAQITDVGADLVITDFQMPGIDGTDLTRLIRAQQLDTPVIMVSGSGDARAVGEAAGVNCFVFKTEIGACLPQAIQSLLLAA